MCRASCAPREWPGLSWAGCLCGEQRGWRAEPGWGAASAPTFPGLSLSPHSRAELNGPPAPEVRGAVLGNSKRGHFAETTERPSRGQGPEDSVCLGRAYRPARSAHACMWRVCVRVCVHCAAVAMLTLGSDLSGPHVLRNRPEGRLEMLPQGLWPAAPTVSTTASQCPPSCHQVPSATPPEAPADRRTGLDFPRGQYGARLAHAPHGQTVSSGFHAAPEEKFRQ